MHKIKVLGYGKDSEIIIDESYRKLSNYLPNKDCVVIIDDNVYDIYKDFFGNFNCIKIFACEQKKTIETVESVIAQLIGFGADRFTFIVGVGGGITCDIAGFVASVFMRGLQFGFVSTTLLSQVDASVGGKNGVNFNGYKNIIGNFNQPEFVICDAEMLMTLQQKDFISGLSEVVKMALLFDYAMFQYIEKNVESILKRDKIIIQNLVIKSVEAKAKIVSCDERENNIRRQLNLGHTFAHAVEKSGDITHGYAVSIGLVFSAKLSQHFGLVQQCDVERIKRLLLALQLPINTNIDKNLIAKNISLDKKKSAAEIKFILLEKIGKGCEKTIEMDFLKKYISNYDMC